MPYAKTIYVFSSICWSASFPRAPSQFCQSVNLPKRQSVLPERQSVLPERQSVCQSACQFARAPVSFAREPVSFARAPVSLPERQSVCQSASPLLPVSLLELSCFNRFDFLFHLAYQMALQVHSEYTLIW